MWTPTAAAVLLCAGGAHAQQATTAPVPNALDAGGWTFMLVSLAFVWGLTLWCFARVLRTPGPIDPGPAAKP